ncbi:hypothetical protein BH20ACT4_BH20ACT4_10640 [soil metagenome]
MRPTGDHDVHVNAGHGDAGSANATDGADGAVSDEELTAEALAADPDHPLGADAVPLTAGGHLLGLLPEWYMPAPMSTHRTPLRVTIVAAVVLAFLAVAAAGLCTTNGVAEIAW